MWKTLASMNTVKLLYTLIKRAFQARATIRGIRHNTPAENASSKGRSTAFLH